MFICKLKGDLCNYLLKLKKLVDFSELFVISFLNSFYFLSKILKYLEIKKKYFFILFDFKTIFRLKNKKFKKIALINKKKINHPSI